MPKDVIIEEKPAPNPIKAHSKANSAIEKLKSRIQHCSTVQGGLAVLRNEEWFTANQAMKEVFGLSTEEILRMRSNFGFRFDHD